MKETALFVDRFLKRGGKVGSVVPSSRFLVQKMMKMIPFEHCKVIAELGAGTGVMTLAIDRHKKAETQVVVFETDDHFSAHLKHKFSHAHRMQVVQESAEHLTTVLKRFNLTGADCVVSSLPFASLGTALSTKILREIQKALTPKGVFVFYQYTPLRLPLIVKYFSIKRFTFTLLNAPPAFVFACSLRD